MSLNIRNQFITKSISKMYLDDGSADVKFVFVSDESTETIPAHKVIFASSSPVFYAMFFGSLKEGNSIKIVDASPDAFKEFIKLFYLSDVELSLGNFVEVVRLADKYDISEHLKSYTDELKKQLADENLILVYSLARSLGNEDLKKTCKEKIQCSHDMFKSDKFHQIDQQTLKKILMMDLNCSETEIFEGCMAWAKASCKANGLDETNPQNIRKQLGECFHLIRFGAMNLGPIMVSNFYARLFTPDEILDLMRIVTCVDFKSSKFNQTRRQITNDFFPLPIIQSPVDVLQVPHQRFADLIKSKGLNQKTKKRLN